jgi:hypothetical protein
VGVKRKGKTMINNIKDTLRELIQQVANDASLPADPGGLIALCSAAVGALAGLLAPSPMTR